MWPVTSYSVSVALGKSVVLWNLGGMERGSLEDRHGSGRLSMTVDSSSSRARASISGTTVL